MDLQGSSTAFVDRVQKVRIDFGKGLSTMVSGRKQNWKWVVSSLKRHWSKGEQLKAETRTYKLWLHIPDSLNEVLNDEQFPFSAIYQIRDEWWVSGSQLQNNPLSRDVWIMMNRQMVVHVSMAQVLAKKRYGDILIRIQWPWIKLRRVYPVLSRIDLPIVSDSPK
jgi:hypothetical protein